MTSLPKIHLEILADPEALARHVADWLLAAAVARVRPFAVALSAGPTLRFSINCWPVHLIARRSPGRAPIGSGEMSGSFPLTARRATIAWCAKPCSSALRCPSPMSIGCRPRGSRRRTRRLSATSGSSRISTPLLSLSATWPPIVFSPRPRSRRAHRFAFPDTGNTHERSRWVGAAIGAKREPRITLTYRPLDKQPARSPFS